jgi:Spy/CpxP family protein refolding chaperone
MSRTKKIFAVALTGALAATLAWAQAKGPMMGHGAGLGQFLSTALDLTDAQKAQAKTIFEAARTQSQPLADQLKQGHQAMAAAVKANDAAQIQSLSASQGTLMGQLAAIHGKAMAQFYQILTPDQKAKADTLHSQMMERWQEHRAQQ